MHQECRKSEESFFRWTKNIDCKFASFVARLESSALVVVVVDHAVAAVVVEGDTVAVDAAATVVVVVVVVVVADVFWRGFFALNCAWAFYCPWHSSTKFNFPLFFFFFADTKQLKIVRCWCKKESNSGSLSLELTQLTTWKQPVSYYCCSCFCWWRDATSNDWT